MKLSSLDLFILVAITQEDATAYSLMSRAAISVGASRPSFRRLLEQGLVRATPGQARGRQSYRLTAKGSEIVANLSQHILEVPDAELTQAEAVVRMMVLTSFVRTTKLSNSLLERATMVRKARIVRMRKGKPVPHSQAVMEAYRSMLDVVHLERTKAEARALERISWMLIHQNRPA